MTADWIFLDLDGCLLRRNKTVSDFTAQTLRSVRALGHRLVIVTARPPRSVRRVLPEVFHDLWLLCGNGTLTARGTLLVAQVSLDSTTVEELVDTLVRRFPASRYAYEAGDTLFTSRDFSDFLPADTFTVVGRLRESPAPVNKILITVEGGAVAEEIIAELPVGVSVAVTDGGTLIHVMPAGIDKGTAIAWLLNSEGRGEGETLCFGDDHVDLPMFQSCTWPVALENSLDVLKAVARDFTGHHEDDGVARYLHKRYLTGEAPPSGGGPA